MHIQIQFLILIIYFYIQVNTNLLCPSPCKCISNDNLVCKKKSLQSIPDGIPSDVKRLDISFNSITTLPANAFKKINKLVFLRLSHNDMKTIDKNAFQGLSNLKDLHLEDNDLSYLHPETFNNQLNSLLHVYLGHNEFETIPNLKNSQMTKLNLDSNKIKSALINESFLSNSGLQTLVLTQNYIKRIEKDDFRNLRNTQLKSIMLKMNELEYIDSHAFSYVKNSLTTLELQKNRLLNSRIIEEALKGFNGGGFSMQYLEFIDCGLTTISDTFFKPFFGSKLHQLDLSSNPLLVTVNENAFDGLSHVQIFRMSHCKVNSTKIRFTGMSDLRELYLDSNNLAKCPERLPGSLRIINLEYNNIRKIVKDNFKSLTSLKWLHLKNNAIDTIEPGSFDDLNALQLLDISFNCLSTIDSGIFSRMPNLITLDLFKQRPCIKELKHNSLVLSNLQSLNLEENCIGDKSFDYGLFTNLPMLKNLSLNDNHFKTLSGHIFDGCNGIKYVSLSHNQLSSWSPHTFVPLASVTHIRLDFNEISNVSMDANSRNYLPQFSSLQQISMHNNKWNCTCNNIGWLLAFKTKLQELNYIICTWPNEKSQRRLFTEMQNCPKMYFMNQLINSSHFTKVVVTVVILFLAILGFLGCFFRKRIKSKIIQLRRKIAGNNYSHLYNSNEEPSNDSDLLKLEDDELPVNSPLDRLTMNGDEQTDSPNNLENSYLGPLEVSFSGNGSFLKKMDQRPPCTSNGFSKKYSENTGSGGTNSETILPVYIKQEPRSDWKAQLQEEEEVDVGVDIVLVMNDEIPKEETIMTVLQIKNLETYEAKKNVCHCKTLVIDYPPPDREVLIKVLKIRNKINSNYIFVSETRPSELDDAKAFAQQSSTREIEKYTLKNIYKSLKKIA